MSEKIGKVILWFVGNVFMGLIFYEMAWIGTAWPWHTPTWWETWGFTLVLLGLMNLAYLGAYLATIKPNAKN